MKGHDLIRIYILGSLFAILFLFWMASGASIPSLSQDEMKNKPYLESYLGTIETAWDDEKFDDKEYEAFMSLREKVSMETTKEEFTNILIELEENPNSRSAVARYENLLDEIRSLRGGYSSVLHSWDDERFDEKEWGLIEKMATRTDEDLVGMAKTLEANPNSHIALKQFLETVERSKMPTSDVNLLNIAIAAVIVGIIYSLTEKIQGKVMMKARTKERFKKDKQRIEDIWMSKEEPRFDCNELYWGLDEYFEDERKLKSKERLRFGRYHKETYSPIDESSLKDFLLPEDKHTLSGFLLNNGCSYEQTSELLNQRIERWDLFAKFLNHRRHMIHLSLTGEQSSTEAKIQEIIAWVMEMGVKKAS